MCWEAGQLMPQGLADPMCMPLTVCNAMRQATDNAGKLLMRAGKWDRIKPLIQFGGGVTGRTTK